MTATAGPITFTFAGRAIAAREGQSIAAALYAHGRRIFSRSFKYHRPRGLFCVAGDCPNCLMQVDGRPNVRTCIEPARQGQRVQAQHAWPSLDFDVLRVFDRLARFLPVGFYYKRFHKPRWLWPLFERVVRRLAGLGRIDVDARPSLDTVVEHLHAQVCVIGGGAAGLAAANAAAETGAEVILLERSPQLGGRLLWEKRAEQAPRLNNSVRSLLSATVFGLYEGNLVGAFQEDRLLKIRAQEIIVCTGSRQPLVPFANNDLPGVMTADGVLRLARLHGVQAGHRAVILGERAGLAEQLQGLGIDVVASIPYQPEELQALGGKRLHAVRLGHQEFPCDLLCLATPRVPANELLLQAGSSPSVRAAGGSSEPERQRRAIVVPFAGAQALTAGKHFVCLCEDVTVKDIDQAVAEGFDGIETLKRYTTATMGPCQGKMCSPAAIAQCARATGQDIGTVGRTTTRPPAVPVELAVLAAERRHHPVRRTPMHHWHQAAGARWLDAGQWKRPESYGDPAAEVRGVRSGVGLIDVSTLGKIEVIGPDAATLLERVYLNNWADLEGGKTRYGVMCTEEGILFDDGVGARLGPEHFYLTTTTGNAEGVLQWLELWRATWRLEAFVLNRTPAFAAMNLAGPRARDVLARLTSLDLSPHAFPYLTLRQADVAGVPCRLCRIGFVGELGYEIHCPSSHGLQVWEALIAAGAEFSLQPFGVEAQRILRLEKGHLILGQDTDALADPFGAGLERLVRFDKPQFHGRAALLRRNALGTRSRLVGFHLPDATKPHRDAAWARHLEGCQVIEAGRSVGRVTSARFSPTLEKYLGLAWIPAARATVGARFLIHTAGTELVAEVVPTPFYDPTGKRARS